jgi:DMSO/TMAO reductase YedYZ molybdopterin-dependent catalytic subunit
MTAVRAFCSGLAAGCSFVVVSLVGRALLAVPTLPQLAQDRLVLLLPGAAFSFLLNHLLTLGKPLLFASLVLTQVLIGGLVGIAIGRWGRPYVAALALWLTTGFVLLPLAHRDVFAGSVGVALVTVLGFIAYAVAFSLFAGAAELPRRRSFLRHRRSPVADVVPANDRLRRRLLAGGALGIATVVLTRWTIGRVPVLPSRDRADASGAETVSSYLSPEARLITAIPDLRLPVTPAARFYVVSKNLADPQLSAASWQLRVEGLVVHPRVLRHRDLFDMPAVEAYRTLECISNEVGGNLISNGLWTGARLTDILQRAGVREGATAINFTCADGYTATMPLAHALDEATLLAYKLNHQDLAVEHGFPARILGTNTYGMKNPKWVTRLELVRSPRQGFWQQQGWDEQSVVQTMAQFDTPEEGARLPVGVTTLGGIAFAGDRGIARVEVSTDGGETWNEAMLLPSLGANTWRFWKFPWQPERAADYTIAVRATDGVGTTQPRARREPFPAGATGYDEIHVRVVE